MKKLDEVQEIIAMNKQVLTLREAWLTAKQVSTDAKKEFDEAVGSLTQLIQDIADEKKQPKLPGIAKADECEDAEA